MRAARRLRLLRTPPLSIVVQKSRPVDRILNSQCAALVPHRVDQCTVAVTGNHERSVRNALENAVESRYQKIESLFPIDAGKEQNDPPGA